MTIQEEMGLKIKKLREEQELSQSQLAALVGYKDKTAVAKAEAGKVDLPQSKIFAFAQALKTSSSYLLGEKPGAAMPSHTIAAHFDGDEFTAEELDKIHEFAQFVKSNRK